MIKIITYGTFDHLHQGHINLLKKAKALGDYLIVGVTTENFDITRGKINVQQSLMERIEAVKATGLADEVFPEEYEGQKIDDIKRNNVDIFAIGSDWIGKFDYLNEYCHVVYLPRTEGISSTMIRSKKNVKLGVIGSDPSMVKLLNEVDYIDGLEIHSVYLDSAMNKRIVDFPLAKDISSLLKETDAIYIACKPVDRYKYIKLALEAGKHVICDSPVALKKEEAEEVFLLAHKNKLCLYDSIKTAYSLAFSRLVLLIKSGIIGEIKSIDSTCTSQEMYDWLKETNFGTSMTIWGPFGLLPVLKILGTEYKTISFNTLHSTEMKDIFTKINFTYDNAVATVNVGVGVKSEGDLRIAGTKGYIYVPAPWWKTEYFEIRFENQAYNKRYFYKLDGEGLRTELVNFVHSINTGNDNYYLEEKLSKKVSEILEAHNKAM
ncbi:MAG: adenylyltransferase/cytidyltransferase family protein [Anaeroplasmataceae bacterium]|nr:adenylyltransferase/cytidyltransferase family protein [Anaeroplasmataceae bacterium]MDE6414470.1 adenylyltransferase/cytidyltransferase family protein [Anaeroplasmataceae bacterium]